MHRSGTSALTRVFSLLGAKLPRNVMGPGNGNTAGHWESNDLVVVHDEMLHSAGSRWDDWRAFNAEWSASGVAEDYKQRLLDILKADFANAALFLVKDPRICRFFPVWRELLESFGAQIRVVIPVRNPLEVASSLKARDGILPTKSYLIWLRHVLDAERATRDLPRAIVTYDLLMSDWRRLADTVSRGTDIKWPSRSDSVALEIDRFLSEALRHFTIEAAELNVRGDVVDWVKDAHRALLEIAAGKPEAGPRAALDRIAAEFGRAATAFGMALAEEAGIAEDRRQDNTRLSAQLDDVRRAAAARDEAQAQEQQRLERALADEQARAAALTVGLSDSQREMAQLQHQLESARAATRAVSEQIAQLERERDAARAHGQAREQELLGAVRDLDGARQFLRESQTEVQRLAGELDAARGEAARFEAARQRADELAGGLAAALTASTASTADTAAREAEHRDQLAAAEQEAAAAVAALDAVRGELGAARDELAERERQAGDLSEALDMARAQNAVLTLSLEGAQHEHRRALAMAQAESAAARADAEAARAVAEAARADAHTERAAAQAERAAAAARDSEAARRHTEQTTALTAELTASRRQAGERGAEAASLSRDLTEARALLDELRGTLGEQARLAAGAAPGAPDGLMGRVRRLWSRQARARAARRPETEAIERSRLFAARWYLERYPDVAAAGEDPLWHYMQHGSAEGRDPHPLFDGRWYAAQVPELAATGLSALGHYVMLGAAQGRDPHPLFDTDWYLAQNPDVGTAQINPLYHFWKIGGAHGRDPHPLFDTSWYLERNPDVARAGDNALDHYLSNGWKEGRDPHPLFDGAWFRRAYPDASPTAPLIHMIEVDARNRQ